MPRKKQGSTGASRVERRVCDAAVAIHGESALAANAIAYQQRALVQTTLPHRDPGDATEHVRSNGHTTLYVTAPSSVGLPYGALPRLILMWLATRAVRERSREILLGASLYEWLRSLGYRGRSGGRNGRGNISRIRDQLTRLQHASIMISRVSDTQTSTAHLEPIRAAQLHWRRDGLAGQSLVVLDEDYYQHLVAGPVPLDWRAIQALRQSPLALDLYAWLTHRYSTLRRDTAIPWAAIQAQFGCVYQPTARGARNFRGDVRRALQRIELLGVRWDYIADHPDHLILRPSQPHIPRRDATADTSG